jgi:hypothetical protein
MIKTSRICFILVVVVISFFQSYSQKNILVNESYTQKPINFIIDDLASKYKVNIFYKIEALSKEQLTINYANQDLTAVLIQLVGKSNLVPLWHGTATIALIDKTFLSRDAQAKFYTNLQKLSDDNTTIKNNVLVIGEIQEMNINGRANIKGQIKDNATGETMIGASLLIDNKAVGVTDVDGNYSINVTPGSHELRIKYVGFQDYIAALLVRSNGTLNVNIEKESFNLDEVTITTVAKDASVSEAQVGINRIDIKQLDRLPTFLGEKDVVKAVLLNPGVSSIGEGAAGYNVRGGNFDQNLIMQDEAILFNASHALGFFSSFNSELIKEASLSKGNLPASSGGRIASSLEVKMKEGNKENFRYKGTINPISATFVGDGPLGEKSNLAFGVRGTFSDYIFGLFSDLDIKNSSASFYDVNLKYSTRLKGGNSLALSGYHSIDNFKYSDKFGFDYKTSFVQLNWDKLINSRTLNKFSIVASNYNSNQQDFKLNFESNLNSGIQYIRLVDKFSKELRSGNIEIGLNSILYNTNPGILTAPENSVAREGEVGSESGIENAVYGTFTKPFGKSSEVIAGVRLNHFASFGGKLINIYKDGIINKSNIEGQEMSSGVVANYFVPEPRLSLKIGMSKSFSFKTGYARTSQFINQIYNADNPTPVNQWQIVNKYIKPTLSHNFSAGIFKNFSNNNYETSVEIYHRIIDRLYDYRPFANIIVNPAIELEILEGKGRSSGAELSLKKNDGLVNGWVSYTYSKTRQTVAGINDGKEYTSPYDKPHNMSLILNFNPILRHTFTANFTYSTGRPSTSPITSFNTPSGLYVPIYSLRNQTRIPDYHRLDLSYNIARTHNNAAKVITSWTFTLYNAYGRKNPFAVFYSEGFNERPQANRLAVVGTPFPALRFNIEFL